MAELKDDLLEIVSQTINKIADTKGLTPKQLAEKAGLSYTTLIPILRGERDFRVSNLVTLANALKITPNDLLLGTYTPTTGTESLTYRQPKYFALFIASPSLTYCQLIDLKTHHSEQKTFQFAIDCTGNAFDVIGRIRNAITNTAGKNINFEDVYLYTSVQGYEHVDGRARFLDHASKIFSQTLIEPDWMNIHKAILPENNGIVLTINDGSVLSYSNDHGKTLHKRMGYYFPISDEVGNFWLGFQAIRHAINVAESIEECSLLSDKILSLFNSDLDLVATRIFETPKASYLEAASVLKEQISQKGKAYQIIKNGFELMWKHILQIDKLLDQQLPVYLAGDLASLYEEFVPKKRLIKIKANEVIKRQFEHGSNELLKLEKNLHEQTKNYE
jgi:N-acetylglucosamine kinase-like BadF-type ATPase/transcriptional regulator with XRE-family HTH domain